MQWIRRRWANLFCRCTPPLWVYFLNPAAVILSVLAAVLTFNCQRNAIDREYRKDFSYVCLELKPPSITDPALDTAPRWGDATKLRYQLGAYGGDENLSAPQSKLTCKESAKKHGPVELRSMQFNLEVDWTYGADIGGTFNGHWKGYPEFGKASGGTGTQRVSYEWGPGTGRQEPNKWGLDFVPIAWLAVTVTPGPEVPPDEIYLAVKTHPSERIPDPPREIVVKTISPKGGWFSIAPDRSYEVMAWSLEDGAVVCYKMTHSLRTADITGSTDTSYASYAPQVNIPQTTGVFDHEGRDPKYDKLEVRLGDAMPLPEDKAGCSKIPPKKVG
ncbi:MAG: hypothetical protein HY683_09355 [Chloroflexi bacterium]|nr:hypothetical protein [Chloroflexota bacterium]